jgi:hypothetical protein
MTATFKQNLEATKQIAANVAEFRANLTPGAMVTIRDVDGVWRVAGQDAPAGKAWCVKQREKAAHRAPGAGALPHDFGPSRIFAIDRLYPTVLG